MSLCYAITSSGSLERHELQRALSIRVTRALFASLAKVGQEGLIRDPTLYEDGM